ncbi:MAG: hypothetical protein A2776_00095 [Candidatus Levybacteria bacterium RIFCSPHIGHO2_01_FULL_40_10]|nr:MAG: hypothetical protein A2776_00095 [Candidatus Levybacteria bacterium RIFCSPHIGHO2_01_FULL_40_10]
MNNKKLFVAGLSYDMTDDQLAQAFAQFGTVVSAQIITDRMSGRSKGFGFVEMSTPEEAAAAMQALNGTDLAGRKIVVNEARPQEPRNNNSGGFSRGGSGGNFRDRDRSRNDRGPKRW